MMSILFTYSVYIYYVRVYIHTRTSIYAFTSTPPSLLMQRGCVGECDANKLLQQVPSWNRVLAVAKVRLGGGSVKHIPKLNTESSGIAQQRLETQCAFEHQSYVHLDTII